MITLSKINDGVSIWDLERLVEGDWSHWRRNIVPHHEDDNGYNYFLNLAGFKKEEVDASVSDGLVVVRAKNKDGSTASYSFLIPEDADVSKMSAKLEDGLLTVSLEKEEKVKPRKLKIN